MTIDLPRPILQGRRALVVGIANDSPYGLAAGVWSRALERADTMARRLRVGTVWINDYHLISEKAPFGGYKHSGLGRELGQEGLGAYLQMKHIHADQLGRRDKKPWLNALAPFTTV